MLSIVLYLNLKFIKASRTFNGNGNWSTRWHQCFWIQSVSYPWPTLNRSRDGTISHQYKHAWMIHNHNLSSFSSMIWAPVLDKSLNFLCNSPCGGAEGNWVSSGCVCVCVCVLCTARWLCLGISWWIRVFLVLLIYNYSFCTFLIR